MMIHEIAPDTFDNQYYPFEPEMNSGICVINKGKMLIYRDGKKMSWPVYEEMKEEILSYTYIFSISGKRYFLAELKEDAVCKGLEWIGWRDARALEPVTEAFAGMTAIHLKNWYDSVQFCGRCGHKAEHDKKERMMRCPECGMMMFPKISPTILVCIHDKEKNKILVTKYSGAENKVRFYALIAGFVEIGETMEECVARETFEETGLRIKNIKYYDNQPWGYTGNLMIAFTAELDGSPEIDLDENELSMAAWISPEDIDDVPELYSLTRTMISRFKHGELF